MKAKFAGEGREWRDPRFRRVTDMTLHAALIAVTSSHRKGAVKVKFFKAPGGHTIHCALWVGDRRGVGTAGGWGYHKPSAALDAAIYDAGIELYGNPYGDGYGDENFPKSKRSHIDGRGEGSMIAALEAIARAQTGDRKVHIIWV